MRQKSLSVHEVAWVALAVLLGLLPHLPRMPFFLTLGFLGAALWRLLGARGHLPLPDREHLMLWLGKQFVAVVAFIAVYIAYRGQIGREAGIELLAALLGLKLLEMRNARDYYLVAFLCYFLVVTNFFYSQSPATAAYMLALVVFITMTLIQFNTPEPLRRTGTTARHAAAMTAQALPLMLVAFIFFPRLPGPLWGLPQDAHDAVTGLSEELRLGHITRLGQSDAIAFRVAFHGREPRATELYWRGPVLWTNDGAVWRRGRVGAGDASELEEIGSVYAYSVTLEPHRKPWLFGLDLVTAGTRDARLTRDRQLLAKQALRQRTRYTLKSAVDYRLMEIDAAERRAALQLPKGWHPRTRELARRFAAGTDSVLEITSRALTYYRESGFVYTLTPAPLPGDAIDEFLFETQQGFCEHFAASFVVLMRAAGVPARIVTGYQGGEYNTVADYMVVRQRDAHAWAEIYDPASGWLRVDPTAAVAPERVSLGLELALPSRAAAGGTARDGIGAVLWTRFSDALDAIAHSWNQWVLGYSIHQQRRLLAALGLDKLDYGGLAAMLSCALTMLTALLGVFMFKREQPAVDPVQGAWLRFCGKLARIGLPRAASEGPRAFADRVARKRGDLAREVYAIARLYVRLRYTAEVEDYRALSERVRAFRPRRR